MRGEDFIERRIVTGLIVSTDYARRVASFWQDDFIGSAEMRRVARWCLDYLAKYDRSPGHDVRSLYMTALKTDQMPRDEAELIQLLLERISDEFDRSDADAVNVGYLFDQTVDHIRDRELRLHNEQVEDLRERGQIIEAEVLHGTYVPFSAGSTRGLEGGGEEGYARVEAAFAETARSLIPYPGALGAMLSSSLTRGGFVAFLAPEKRGKCICGDQRVLMSSGEMLPISEVVRQRRSDIIAYDERLSKFVPSIVSDFYDNGPKRVLALTTRTGRRVKVTEVHPFLTPSGWREVRNLRVGEYIAVPKYLPVFGDGVMLDEQVRLLAYFIADGCLGREIRDNMGFTKGDPEIRHDFERCVEMMSCSVQWTGINGSVINSVDNRYKRDKNFVRDFLRSHGLMRKRSFEKEIPQAVYRLEKSQLALFLSVLITCDGWVTAGGGEIGFGVANEL